MNTIKATAKHDCKLTVGSDSPDSAKGAGVEPEDVGLSAGAMLLGLFPSSTHSQISA